MRVHIFTGSNDAIRDAMASDAAQLHAKEAGVKVENLTEALKVEPSLLFEIDSSLTLFAEPRILMFFGSPETLLKVLAEVSSEETENVLVISSSTFAKSKAKGVLAQVTALPAAKNTSELVQFYLSTVPGFPSGAIGAVTSHVGKEASRLPLLVSSLRSHYGPELSGVNPAQVMELAGNPSAPAPWDLTDAIDRGDIPNALRLSRRLVEGRGSPYGVTVILANHFLMMFRLHEAGIANEHEGAQMLDIKGSTYPVKKAILNARKYGSRLQLMVKLVDQAQADMKGGSGLEPQTIVDILVSRLSAH